MNLYSKRNARDFMYPINKTHISKLYHMALKDMSSNYTMYQKYGHKAPSLFPSFMNINKLYGERVGLHLTDHNREYLEVRIPVLYSTHRIDNFKAFMNLMYPVNLLTHKRKHLLHKPNFFIGGLGLGLIDIPLPNQIETIIIKRMPIKLGGIKTQSSILFGYPYF